MKSIRRIFRYLKYFPREIVLNISFNLLAVVFSMGGLVLIVPFAELLFGMTPPPASPPRPEFSQASLTQWMLWHLYQAKDTLGPWKSLVIVGAAYIGCNLLGNVFRYLGLFFLSSLRTGIVQRLRNDVYHRITILPVSYFNARRRGDISSRLSNDIFDIEWSVVSTMQSLVRDPIKIILVSAMLIFISPKLFGLFLLILPLALFLISGIAGSLKRSSATGQARLGALFSELEENLGAIRVIRAFGQEAARRRHFRQTNHDYARTMVRVAKRRELSSPLSEVLGTMALVPILIVGGSLVLNGEIAASVFIYFVTVFATLISPIQAVVKAYNSLMKGSAAADRIFELLDADEEIVEKPGAYVVPGFHGSIECRDLCFAYEEKAGDSGAAGRRTVLSHVSLVIPKGHTIALVGPSGAGKTTLVDLLPRFYDCTGGAILFDGRPVRDLNIDSLRAQFGLVSQTCILFNDTVANNISFGNPRATRPQIEAAARRACADQFIRSLPQGYDTAIGDLGVALSGGQRQRISIARAMLKNPPIMILDEATSALDNESELAVQQALAQLMRQRTCIIVAHRLSTIRSADEIIVLDHGRIAERGTHHALMRRGGLYGKLVEMQQFA